MLRNILVPLHQLDHHHPYLDQCQIFTQTASRSSTEDKRYKMLMLLDLLSLPSLGNELKGVFK
jgi:hypothetical protein